MNDSRLVDDYDINASLSSKIRKINLENEASVENEKESENDDEDLEVNDENPNLDSADPLNIDELKNVFVSAAMSIDYAKLPPTTKFIRGENIVSCWAMRPVEGEDDCAIFEWLLCIDLKGSLPRYVLNTVSNSKFNDALS